TAAPGVEFSLELHCHALSTDVWDAGDLRSSRHKGTFSTERKNGLGQVVARVEQQKVDGSVITSETLTDYLTTGETIRVTRSAQGSVPVVRFMVYDSLGRMVVNADPHTTKNFSPSTPSPASMKTLRY